MIFNTLFNILTKLIEIYHNLFKIKIIHETKAYLVCKIVDQDIFDEYFPDKKVQPSWEYNNNCITIEVTPPILPVTYDDFLETLDIDIPFFQDFSDIFIYIHYFVNNKEYINVYLKDNIIKKEDFELKETELSKKYSNIICATIGNKYFTKYFKMFLNNEIPITSEMLLLHLKENVNVNVINVITFNENIILDEMI